LVQDPTLYLEIGIFLFLVVVKSKGNGGGVSSPKRKCQGKEDYAQDDKKRSEKGNDRGHVEEERLRILVRARDVGELVRLRLAAV
jgi:hypothetical protein